MAAIIEKCGVPVELVDAQDEFFAALKGKTDPEEKRQAITETFYRSVFGRLVRESGTRFLLQGTNFTDVEETVAGIKRQHNILAQLGIDTEAAYGYKVIEPIIQLRKPAVRAVGKALGLPEEIFNRPPFPGPALAARVIGETTRERVELAREAVAHLPNVDVQSYAGLTVDFAKDIGAHVMVRGLRMSADFEREFEMAMMNKKLYPGLELVCFMANQEYQFLSSSLMKEAASLGGNITSLVPEHVAAALKRKGVSK